MNIICVDDAPLVLQRTVRLIKQFPQVTNVKGFLCGRDVLDHMKTHSVDAVFADIDMPEMGGLELAAIIREKWPDTAIVFLTAYSEYAVSAFRIRANGYLLKPVDKALLEEEILNIERICRNRRATLAVVQTFGNFGVATAEGSVSFSRQKSKEILAYLVSKRGTGVSRAELASILWEDAPYDHGKQKQLDVFIRSLMTTLRENEILEIVEMKSGMLRICPEKIDCDYYHFLDGEPEARRRYNDEFMNSYSWAEYLKPSAGK